MEDLDKKIGKRNGTVLTPGTIYPALKNLRQNGLVVYKRLGRKKFYFFTEEEEEELKIFFKLFSRIFFGIEEVYNKEIRRVF